MPIFRRLPAISQAFVLVALLVCAAPVRAQEDISDSKDHPMVSRMPVYRISEYAFNEFEAYSFKKKNGPDQAVDGKHWHIVYELKDGSRRSSQLEILRNYRNAFQQKGGRSEWYEEPTGGTWVVKSQTGELWCQIMPENEGAIYTLEIVEKAVMQQSIELNESELAKALDEKGSVALHGILFDTGKATIKPESAKQLEAIGALLKSNMQLKLEIQGHTDSVGQKAANQTLSQQRADAVRQYLISNFGVEAARLTAVGFGDGKPVAPNTTEEGRTQNRRVELAKK
jgi:OmpA-OmpF porin, OOP family